jgi:hypothetical protein
MVEEGFTAQEDKIQGAQLMLKRLAQHKKAKTNLNVILGSVLDAVVVAVVVFVFVVFVVFVAVAVATVGGVQYDGYLFLDNTEKLVKIYNELALEDVSEVFRKEGKGNASHLRPSHADLLGTFKISTKLAITKVKDLNNVHLPTAALRLRKGANDGCIILGFFFSPFLLLLLLLIPLPYVIGVDFLLKNSYRFTNSMTSFPSLVVFIFRRLLTALEATGKITSS